MIKLVNNEKENKIPEILFECKKLMMTMNFIENEETQKLKTKLFKFGVKENVSKF